MKNIANVMEQRTCSFVIDYLFFYFMSKSYFLRLIILIVDGDISPLNISLSVTNISEWI